MVWFQSLNGLPTSVLGPDVANAFGGIWGSVGHKGKKLNAGCGMHWKDPQADGVVAGRQRELLVQARS